MFGRIAPLAMIVAMIAGSAAVAQQPPNEPLPEPKMPPMPSMEGQQGDVAKPVTPPAKAAPKPDNGHAAKAKPSQRRLAGGGRHRRRP